MRVIVPKNNTQMSWWKMRIIARQAITIVGVIFNFFGVTKHVKEPEEKNLLFVER